MKPENTMQITFILSMNLLHFQHISICANRVSEWQSKGKHATFL